VLNQPRHFPRAQSGHPPRCALSKASTSCRICAPSFAIKLEPRSARTPVPFKAVVHIAMPKPGTARVVDDGVEIEVEGASAA